MGEYLHGYPDTDCDETADNDGRPAYENNLTVSHDDNKPNEKTKAGPQGDDNKKEVRMRSGKGRKSNGVPSTVYDQIRDYDYVLPQQARPPPALPSARLASEPESQHVLPLLVKPQSHCGRSARFWCLLTAVQSVVIVILLSIFLTGKRFLSLFEIHFIYTW